MARLITTIAFEGKPIYDGKSYATQIAEWENTTGRTVCVAVRAKLGKTGGFLTNSAANFRIGLELNPGGAASLEPVQAKNIAASTTAILRSFNTIDVLNGEKLRVAVSSDNAGDTDIDGDVLFFDMMTGIDVRAIGGADPETLYVRDTTVAVEDSTTSFTLSAGKASNNAYDNMIISIQDADDSNVEVRRITNWTSGRVVTVDRAFSFTPAAADVVHILENAYGNIDDTDIVADVDAVGVIVVAIQAKTDNLPAAPANEVTSAAIKAKTDNLPTAPANEVTVAAVKAKTDLLPAAPANEVTSAAIKAQTDKFKFNDDNDVHAILSAAGSGAITVDYYVYENESERTGPIGTCKVWITSDVAGATIVASGHTDNFGKVTFQLDAGTYYFWRKKTGYNFTNPDTEVVS